MTGARDAAASKPAPQSQQQSCGRPSPLVGAPRDVYVLPMKAGKESAMTKQSPRVSQARSAGHAVRGRSPVATVQPEGPLVVRFMDAMGMVNVERITQTFGMTRIQLAETAGLGRDTFQKTARQEAAKTQVRVKEMLEIVGRIEPWAGGQPQAMAWYRAQPIAALDGRTAEALVKSGKAGVVRDYLDHIAVGGFA